MARTLIFTNDFPPRQGGIESFVSSLAEQLPPEEIVIYTASMPGAAEFDSRLPYPVIRDTNTMLLPTPAVRQRVVHTLGEFGCESVLFGAAAPLGLLAGALRDAGARRIVGLTHGHETWWARVPGPSHALRRIADACDALTYVSDFCRRRIAPALSDEAARRLVRLAPGVDSAVFEPDNGGGKLRGELGIAPDRPVLLSVGRFIARKGHDTLIKAMPRVLDSVPDALLVLVGAGPYRGKLERLVRERDLGERVIFAGSVPWGTTPAWFDLGDVFAMPCRTRLGGLEPEALGIVFLEAQAAGRPVLVGDSGGAPETVRHGETGYVVDPFNPVAVATRAAELLADPERARMMGQKGREWVERDWNWAGSIATLHNLLGPR